MNPYVGRRENLVRFMKKRGVRALVVEDFEIMRTRALRYLCGHPSDAILIVFDDGTSVLVPWDMSIARARAQADRVLPFTDFSRSFKDAITAVVSEKLPEAQTRVIEISGRTPHARYVELCAALPETRIVCEEGGMDELISGMRCLKDAAEAASLRQAARITNELIGRITDLLRSAGQTGLTEILIAQFIEREALGLGAEGLGFETLVAGPKRSWAIHPFPPYTAGPFGGSGLSIIDFGVTVDGYTSDVTLTVVKEPLSEEQQLMVGLVRKAYDVAVAKSVRGASPLEPARAVDEVFAAEGRRMPHSLGHGIGLDAHERPYLRLQGERSDPALLPGMAFTLEPALYHPEHGGVRLENDVLMTDAGPETLTEARIIDL
jgi:Xaa-Pro dipeptidase